MNESRLQTILLGVIAALLAALLLKPQAQRFIPTGNETALDTKTGMLCVTVHNQHPDASDPPQCASVR